MSSVIDRLPLRPYPSELFDSEGYPTQEALDYLENWMCIHQDGTSFCGEYMFKPGSVETLIAYLKLLWCYNDGIVQDGGLLEIHTFGWSGNEEIIPYLKKTEIWTFKLRATQVGGHYFFNINDENFTYEVQKVENTWQKLAKDLTSQSQPQ